MAGEGFACWVSDHETARRYQHASYGALGMLSEQCAISDKLDVIASGQRRVRARPKLHRTQLAILWNSRTKIEVILLNYTVPDRSQYRL